MNSSTNWIWIAEDDGRRNLTVCSRRSFDLDQRPSEAYIEITADSRYILFINGLRVGQGPNRSWNHLKQYDRYEVSRYLRGGKNVIAVQIVRWGVKNGYYEGGPGGLIVELHTDQGSPNISTDSSWKMALHPGYLRRVPRMAHGQAFCEQYDARYGWDNWAETDFNDTDWPPSRTLGPVGTPPWKEMRPRSIPYLTEQPLYPVRVFDVCAVTPPRYSYAFDLYDALREPEGAEDDPCLAGVIVAELFSDRDAEITMVRMNQTWNLDLFGEMRVNGVDVEFPSDRATFSVRAGSNLLVVKFNGYYQAEPSWVFETDADMALRSPVGDSLGPAAVYACRSIEAPAVVACWTAQRLNDIEDQMPKLRPLRPDERYTDVFALSNMRSLLPETPAVMESPYALCSASSEYAMAATPSEGDLEFLLDFGEEIVGLIQFELDAPDGTIIDLNCFEAIVDGEWKWTDNLNNTIRYIAGEGWQRFDSAVRRGFRYAQVTVRNASRPVRIREILCLQNTYPVQYEGSFACSDALLTQLWDMARRTTRLCMEDTFVDCPAYEQTFWVGDSRNESLGAYVAFGDTALAERCLRLVPESLWRSPIPESATPMGYTGILPNWGLFWIIACREHYQYTGNRQFVKDILPPVLQTCRFMLSRRNEQGLWHYAAWNMIDWASMDSPPDAVVAHENMLMTLALRRAAELSDISGEADGDDLRSAADAMTTAINDHFWNDDSRGYVDSIHADGKQSTTLSQQTQTLAYLCDCAPPERAQLIERYLTQVPEGWVKIGTPWMMWFTCEVLAKKREFSAILDLIRTNWGQMLKFDATTCWEMFPGWSKGRWDPTRSWCHAWSAAPGYFLSTYQLGVTPLEPGCRRVLVAPQPCGLTWAKGRYPTPRGTILIEWEVADDRFNLQVILPPGVDADVHPPQGLKVGNIDVRRSVTTTSPEHLFS